MEVFEPVSSTTSSRLKTARQYLDDCKKLVDQALTSGSFNRETEAKFNATMRLFESVRASGEHGLGELSQQVIPQLASRTIDPATLAFLNGRQVEEPVISVFGGKIERQGISRVNGKSVGAMTVLRDCSSMFGPENRTYAGLTSAKGGADGGNLIPTGFIPIVLEAMKRTDQVLEAANWDVAMTADGRPQNLPSMTDTAVSAVSVSEGGSATLANPTALGNLSWPEATMWSSQIILASIPLDQDSGVSLAGLLGDAFRIRFARGFGAHCITFLLSDTPTGATTASPTAITQADLLALLGSIDPTYGAAETAGWIMNWSTLVYIFTNVITTASAGDALYHAKQDGSGHYLLFGKPVFVSPSLPSIGSTNVPVMYGDWNRFLIRNVPSEAVVRRYDEIYMQMHQRGFEMLFRADAQVAHAGGSGDNPIVALACHA